LICLISLAPLNPDNVYYFFLPTHTGLRKFYVRRADVSTVRAVIDARVRRRRAWRAELNEARAFLRLMMSNAVEVKI